MNSRPKRSTFRSRYEDMMITLRNEIITNIWEEGSFLPSESDLADRFELSKNSVRKGLELLASENFIEKIPRVGNRILKSPAGITIKFGYYPSMIKEAQINDLVDEFHKQHPLIRINMIPMPYSHTNPTMKDYMESDNIDVMTINNQNIELFTNFKAPPSILDPQVIKEGVYPKLTEPFMHDGDLYVQPFMFSPVILCYNKKHFSENNVPEPDSSWTWDTVKKAAHRLATGSDRYGFFFHLLSDNRWPIFLLQNNVVFNRGKETNISLELDKTTLKDSFQTLIDLSEEVFPPFLSENDQDVDMLFRQQKVSMIITSYFLLNMIEDVDFSYDISPLPYHGSPKTLVIVIGLAINKNSKHKQAAQTFIDYMLSHEVQLKLRQNTLSLPSLKSAAEWNGQVNVKQPERYFIFRETFPTFNYHTDLNVSFSELEEIRQNMKLYLSKMAELHVFS
ncbi:extracellular solute-binding protein [Paenibacillus albiflavus]|uniref:Extracellular solute-binding protein n=1 Tax=Paenibacillus albiflavus TaxID=2545760 RepID=A0A4R4EAY7_9BACL|nr:extracellular solute-binding protein [Paenibacillus albiflavus]TCZ75068.1 extracellular solute-binding protein [Paenibacillus albiflavus]